MQATTLQQKLHAAGLRLTTARERMVRTLATATTPLTLSTLADRTDVDQATVYRNLPALQKAGVIEAITLAPGDTRYALTHSHHDHAVCTDCGTVEHIHCTTPQKPRTSTFASIDRHEVIYYGLCKNCSS